MCRFYRDRLGAVLRGDGAIDLDRWTDIPVFGRAAAQQAGAELFAVRLPDNNETWTEGQTSGSTGIPLRHRRSNLADLASRCLTQRDHDWYKLDMTATLADIHESWDGSANFPEGRGGGRWNIRDEGDFCYLDVRTSVAQQLDWLQRVRPRYLMTYPSLLRGLAEHVIESGRIGMSFDLVMTIGETLPPDVRTKTQRAFGADIMDRYGAQEIGHVATQCSFCGQYHASAESVLVEVLRDDGTPAQPAEIGRVVLTSFYNYAMPFIRYEIGDFAEVGWIGLCPRTLPALRRILGRERNMFVLPDGAHVWPDTRTSDMQRFVAFKQVQVVQTTPENIEVRYVPADGAAAPDAAGLQKYFRAVLHPALTVTPVAVDRIDRLRSAKFEDYVSLVAKTSGPP